MRTPGNWMRCTVCRTRFPERRGRERVEYVRSLLDLPHGRAPTSEDIALFGDECPKCGCMGVPETYPRKWR